MALRVAPFLKRLQAPALISFAGATMWQRRQFAFSETHADKVGSASGRGGSWAGMAADGNVDSMRSASDEIVSRLGKPTHTHCCPTGTMEFARDESECNAVQATVKALTQKISSEPPKILILYGSLRQASCSRKAAVESARVLASYGADVRVFDPQDLPHFSTDTDPKHPKVAELRSLTRWCEGMVWISPEIHGNISGVFKNQVDWMPLSEGAIRPTQGKTVAVMQVEAGSQSFNTVNNLRTLGRWMRCVVIPNQSSIPQAYKEFNEDGTLKDSSYRSRIVDVLDELFKYTLLLRDQQPYLVERYSEKKVQADKVVK
jgi:arsenic resistance protein ArsH